MESQKPYIPRTDLGFTDRRRSVRFELRFTDEAEIENWEASERFEEPERGAVGSRDSELVR